MSPDPPPSLAAALTMLRRRERVSYAHIARCGHLTRSAVKLIADGTTRQPSILTVAGLALGLATDPDDGRLDQEKLFRYLSVLGDASGLGDIREKLLTETLPLVLAAIVGDHALVVGWVRAIADPPDALLTQIEHVAEGDADA